MDFMGLEFKWVQMDLLSLHEVLEWFARVRGMCSRVRDRVKSLDHHCNITGW
ncbi:hypothetical protein J2T17_003275 [Paenibacillus mucilaginosus]